MALTVGDRLGHYNVTALIGEGGMGQVYRATDTQLVRDVALKILPDAFAADPDRLARFQREAQVLASLNHPGIAAIYGIETSDGKQALVLELVEGPTLADRIAQGAMPIEDALPIARQIAEALEAAHEAGVIHRDLKPANIKVRDDGTVKVLDFGLAKALNTTPEGEPSQSPTLTAAATQMGVIMGTAAYMSPEQARGSVADHRADVWSFGVVLYEMLTGKGLFTGLTVSDTLASVLKTDSDLGVLPPGTPTPIRRLLRRCLEKDRRERLPHVGEARLEIRDALAAPSAERIDAVSATHRARPRRDLAALAIGVVLIAVVAGLGGWRMGRSRPTTEVQLLRSSIGLPEGTVLPAGVGADIAIAPDGQTLVYVGGNGSGRQLYVRAVNQFARTPIPGTEGAQEPFLSPDGQSVAFTVGFETKRVALAGGEVFTVCDRCFGAFWGDDGYIVYDSDGVLWRVPAVGGTPEVLAEPKPDQGVPWLAGPASLPGGRAVLFEIGNLEFGGIGVVSLETNEMIVVSEEGSDPRHSATGHILFARGSTLFAVPFDVDNFRVAGSAVPVTQNVHVENGGAIQAALSEDGLFVYKPAGEVGTQLVWANQSGTMESMIEDWRVFYGPQLSPDGEQLAVQINEDGGSAVWIREVESGSLRRLTLTENAAYPVWSPDGARVAFGAGAGGAFTIQSIAADGTGPVETLLESELPIVPNVWASDELVFREDSPNPNLFVIEVGSDGSRKALRDSEFTRHSAALSPSGTWLAYVSNRSGSDEVHVVSFPEPGAEHVISNGGGAEPVWGADETKLFYRRTNGLSQMVASIQIEPLRVLSREALFETPDFWWGNNVGRAQYDFDSDARRVLDAEHERDGWKSGRDSHRPKLVRGVEAHRAHRTSSYAPVTWHHPRSIHRHRPDRRRGYRRGLPRPRHQA